MSAGRVFLMPCQPPTLRSPIQTSGAKPATIKEELKDFVVDGRGEAAEEDVTEDDDGDGEED